MRNRSLFTVIVIVVLILTTYATVLRAAAPEGVSPGAVDRLSAVAERCPTFNWVAAEGALYYELAAYSLPDTLDDALIFRADLAEATEVLYTTIPGGATGWTPAADQGLAPGGRYVWFVRAVNQVQDDEAVEATEWSRGRFFAIPAGPTEDELNRALEVLRQWQESGGGHVVVAPNGVRTLHATSNTPSNPAGPRSPKSVPTAAAAIRGEQPDPTGETYGVVGTSASPGGAGLGAANTAGGPDLVLDGSADGRADTYLSESGLYRSVTGDLVFEMLNTSEGSLSLDVQSHVYAAVVDVSSVEIAGTTVIDNDGAWLGEGSTVPCAGCITSSDLANDSVTSAKIAAGAVEASDIHGNSIGSSHILDGAIANADLANNSVTSAKIGNGAVDSSEIRAGAVTSTHIDDGTVATVDLAVGAVNSAAILDNGIIATDLAAGSVGTSEIADGSVTGADIQDGTIRTADIDIGGVTSTDIRDDTITASDVDPTGGVYASKSAVYVVTDSQIVPAWACQVANPTCSDANDLPLYATFDGDLPNLSIERQEINFWNSMASAAGYLVEACDQTGSGGEITAFIACVAVPGA